ncbi:MAG: hypothetical protein MEQ84_01530 [Mesorhizobium sp.]|nr:hypothetical protein [Mesorhizobium sp.]
MRKGGSESLSFLMRIASAPMKKAASRAISAASWMAPDPGSLNTTAPAKAMPAAPHRHGPTFSPSRGMARIMATIGLRKLMAVASASRIMEAAAKRQETPAQPKQTRMA